MMPYTAEQILHEFPPVEPRAGSAQGNGQDAEPLAGLVRQILTGEAYHGPLCALAWRHLMDGMDAGKVVLTLRGLMDAGQGPRDDRWHARYEEIPRTVSTAEEKLGQRQAEAEAEAEQVAADGAVLLQAVHAFLLRFVAYPSTHACIAHVLWIAHAHLM